MRYDWRHVDFLLKEWADWVRFGRACGFRRYSPGQGFTEVFKPDPWFRVGQYTARAKQSRPAGGHIILCELGSGEPRHIRKTKTILGTLPKPQYLAVAAWYGLVDTHNGERYTPEQKAHALGITPIALSERLRRARKNFAKALAFATGQG